MALKLSKASQGVASGGAFISRSQLVGDPGLFGFIGKALKGAAGLARRIPGPIGAAAGFFGGRATGQFRPPPLTIQEAPRFFQQAQQLPVIPEPGLGGLVRRALPFGQTGLVVQQPENGVTTKLACQSGFHPNKAAYFLRDGTFIEKETLCVKNRTRNPLNPRAASRAISRIESAKKATSRLNRISIRPPPCPKK